ncbi:ABC transporter substrate-binding protein [Oscillospiraceae bacterium MB08-C2-2]|nr:ABC transporter substrate-binding protein [Oscillospiraceae bacterium MB08-C2-2]
MKNSLRIACLMCAMLLILAGCGGAATPAASSAGNTAASQPAGSQEAGGDFPDTVKIAFIYPLSGANAESGKMCTDGANLAVKHINEAGGIQSMGGAKVELVIYDGTSDPAQGKNVAERALSDKSILAAVGSGTSALTLPMLPAFEKARVPLVTFTNSKDLTNQGYKYIFSTTNRGSDLGLYNAMFIQHLNDSKGANIKKVAIIYENSANGISMAEGARGKAKDMGLEIVFDESYPAGNVDFAPMVTAMKNSGADAVLPYGYMQEAKLIFSTMRDLSYFPIIMGNSNWPSYYEALGEATNGVIAVGNWNFSTTIVQNNPEYQAIVDGFEKEYGYYMTEQAGPAYDGVRIIAAALELNPTTDSTVLRDTISSNEFQGMQLSGAYKFNEAGENVNGVPAVTQWQYGKPVCVFPEEFSVNEYINPSEFKK